MGSPLCAYTSSICEADDPNNHNGDHEVVLKAELPDMTREDIDITVDNGTLTIKGDKKLSSEV
jgi:HSP20 family molecular chaperone IbpA